MSNKDAMDFQYVFGPVASRRLGLSLGVDLVRPKTCTLDCVYCESGRTTCLTLERKDWVPVRDVLEELARILKDRPRLDSITFSGSGEPTLHKGIGTLIREIKKRWPEYPVTVLTNGTLLWQEAVREDLSHADRVVANYDAADPLVFARLNRPAEGLSPDTMAEGLVRFRDGYTGSLWLEVFVIPGLNDTEDEIAAIAATATRIRPDRIQLNSLDRPGTEDWVQPADAALLARFQKALGVAEAVGETRGTSEKGTLENETVAQRILDMIRRRPVTKADVVRTLGILETQASFVLNAMEEAGEIREEKMPRGCFYLLPEREAALPAR